MLRCKIPHINSIFEILICYDEFGFAFEIFTAKRFIGRRSLAVANAGRAAQASRVLTDAIVTAP
jgi:hypothetical protein